MKNEDKQIALNRFTPETMLARHSLKKINYFNKKKTNGGEIGQVMSQRK